MKRYAIDLDDLGTETLTLEGVFAPGEIDFSHDELSEVGPIRWEASISERDGEVRFTGELSVEVEQACVRCLDPVREEITRVFDLFFERREDGLFSNGDDVALGEEDTDTSFLVDAEFPVDDVIREQIVLALPMKPLCDASCKGLCVTCGRNLNHGPCGCAPVLVNPAFEPLLELKKRLGNQD
jgi:uncharacterized protein